MTGNDRAGTRILGSMRSADGTGVVRIKERFDTNVGDLWSALTDPPRLARWIGDVGGGTSAWAVSSVFASLPAGRRAPGALRRASLRGGCC